MATAVVVAFAACSDDRGPDRSAYKHFADDGVFVFEGGLSSQGAAVTRAGDGAVVAAGSVRPPRHQGDGDGDVVVLRLSARGEPDDRFGVDGAAVVRVPHGDADQVVVQEDGKVVVAGSRSEGDLTAGRRRAFVARLSASGRLDPSFGEDGVVELADGPAGTGVAALHFVDGRLLVATVAGESVTLSRLGLDGAVEPGFGASGRVELAGTEATVVVDQRHRLVVTAALADGRSVVRRLLPNGAVDPGFGRGGVIEDDAGMHVVAVTESGLAGVAVGQETGNSVVTVTRLAEGGRIEERTDVARGGRFGIGAAAADGDRVVVVGGEEDGDARAWLPQPGGGWRDVGLGVSPGFAEAAVLAGEDVVVVGTTGYGTATPRLFVAKPG